MTHPLCSCLSIIIFHMPCPLVLQVPSSIPPGKDESYCLNSSIIYKIGNTLSRQPGSTVLCLDPILAQQLVEDEHPIQSLPSLPQFICLPISTANVTTVPHWILLVVDTSQGAMNVFCSSRRGPGRVSTCVTKYVNT